MFPAVAARDVVLCLESSNCSNVPLARSNRLPAQQHPSGRPRTSWGSGTSAGTSDGTPGAPGQATALQLGPRIPTKYPSDRCAHSSSDARRSVATFCIRVTPTGGGNDGVSCWPPALARNVPRPEPGDARSSRSQRRSPWRPASCYDVMAVDCHQLGAGGKTHAARPVFLSQ